MTIEFHPAVQQDFNEALARYEAAGGVHLADRFELEFRSSLMAIKVGPTRFPPYHSSPMLRRIRLKSFPYLIVYREISDAVRVTLLKHERRHPLYGLHRW